MSPGATKRTRLEASAELVPFRPADLCLKLTPALQQLLEGNSAISAVVELVSPGRIRLWPSDHLSEALWRKSKELTKAKDWHKLGVLADKYREFAIRDCGDPPEFKVLCLSAAITTFLDCSEACSQLLVRIHGPYAELLTAAARAEDLSEVAKDLSAEKVRRRKRRVKPGEMEWCTVCEDNTFMQPDHSCGGCHKKGTYDPPDPDDD